MRMYRKIGYVRFGREKEDMYVCREKSSEVMT